MNVSSGLPPAIPETSRITRTGLYQAVWRWHFYAALFVTPFILVFAVTGGIYLFKPQIEGWLYRDLYRVSPSAGNKTPEFLLSAALERFPGSRAEAYTPPADRTCSALVRLVIVGGRKLTVALNPYSGAVLGVRDEGKSWMPTIRELHGKLLLGATGQAVQELAASWALILVMTGIYLWWPRPARGSATGERTKIVPVGSVAPGGWLRGGLLPRLNASGRIFWRDLHAVTGFWISGLLVFLIVTGLPWSVVSGALLHEAAAWLGKGSPDTGLGWDGGGSRTVQSGLAPFPGKNAGFKDTDWTIAHASKLAGTPSSSLIAGRSPLSLSRIIQKARKIPGLQAPFEVRMPVDARGVFSIVTDHGGNPPAMIYMHLDQYTGDRIKEIRWKDFGPLAQAIALGVALHEGRYFGLPNQLLGLTACLGLIVMLTAGIVLWWQRRPAGGLGAPSTPDAYRTGPLVLGLIVVLSVMMPLMGASLLVVLAGERLAEVWIRHRRARISNV